MQETEEQMKRREKDVQELDVLLACWEEHSEILDHLDWVMKEERQDGMRLYFNIVFEY
jgi:hypothetical protein